ncbi:MAG TPA: hypothetical protein VF982_10285 [Anaerolineales bacterium]
MSKSSIKAEAMPELVQNLLRLVEAHRRAFRQERSYVRSLFLLVAEVMVFARHTVTQGLMALGMTESDWSGWYRLFSQRRFDEEVLNGCLLRETLQHVPAEDVYVVGTDGTQIARSSHKMPGTSWLKAPRTPPFRVGIHRAQQFVHLAWLTPMVEGFSRAIPLRFLPAFPPKAVAAEAAPCTEWAASLAAVRWVRTQLDEVGRSAQWVLLLADGRYDTLGFWKGLPQRVVAAVRTSRHRVLYELPPAGSHKNRKYGAEAPKPAEWLQVRDGWHKVEVVVRGHLRSMRYRVEGPYRRQGAAQQPLFLLVVKGESYKKGKRQPKLKHRKPAFYLVSAVYQEGAWCLPLPVLELLAWLWQRWELEVAHREMKSGFGVGEKQCWSKRSAIVSVQWSVWVYAVLLLAGYRTWGLCAAPVTKTAWWPRPGGSRRRWSFNTLWRNYRAALWGSRHFQALYTRSSADWPAKKQILLGLDNAILGAARA